MRSLVVPGWGQAYNQQPLKAVIYAGLEQGLIYGIYRNHTLFRQSQLAGLNDDAGFYKNERNRLGWYLAGTLILSVMDAFVDAHLFSFDVSDDLSDRARRIPIQNRIRIGLRFDIK